MKMSLIVFGALAVSFALRRRSAALRHWVLAAGVAAAAAAPLLAHVLPAWTVPFGAPASFAVYEEALQTGGSPPSVAPGQAPAGPRAVGTWSSPTRASAVAPAAALRAAWLAGAALGAGILLVGMLRLMWLAARAKQVTEGRWHDLASELARACDLRRPVTLLQSDHPSLLVTWGLARPKVILPSDANTWSDARARVVLSHELAHIRRGDWIVQLLAEAVRAVYWFNPLLWIACRRLRLESELACDDEVMSGGVEGSDYARHLIDLARSLNRRRHSWFPAPAMARPSSLERRVRAMLNHHLDRGRVSGGARAAIFALLLAAASAVAAAQGAFATVSGSIVDESGLGVPGTTVVLVSDARQAKYEVKTNGMGRFEFVGLPAGAYRLEASGIGFQPLTDAIDVSGQNIFRNYTLKIGTLQETIVVVESADNTPGAASGRVRERPVPAAVACVPSAAGGRIVPPKKVRDVSPIFPAGLRGSDQGGVVRLDARIGIDGRVSQVNLVGEAHPEFATSAIDAVREWVYTETLLNCQPVDVLMGVTVTYKPAAR